MKKMMKYLLVVCLIVAIVVIAILCLKKNTRVVYDGKITYFSESSSGDMSGGHKSTIVKYAKDKQKVIVIYSSAKWHSDDDTVIEYYVSPKIFDELTEIVNRTKLYNAENLPDSGEIILDGATRRVTVDYDDRKRFSYSSNQKLTEKVYETEKEINFVIAKYCEGGEKIPTVIARKLYDENTGLESCDLGLHISSINGCYLYYKIINSSGSDFLTDGKLSIYKLVDGEYVEYLVCDDVVDKSFASGVGYGYDEYVELEKENILEAGTYKAVIGNLEDIFDVDQSRKIN